MTPPPVAGILEALLEQKERQLEECKKQEAENFRRAFLYQEALDAIIEDIDAWLAGESDEPSLEFIKAIKAHAEKTILGK